MSVNTVKEEIEESKTEEPSDEIKATPPVFINNIRSKVYKRITVRKTPLKLFHNPLKPKSILDVASSSSTPFSEIELSPERVITSLVKIGNKRSERDLTLIRQYLNETDLVKMFKKDKIDDSSLEKIKFFCSYYIEYSRVPKKTVLFRTGDQGDKFYLIIKGKVSILKPVEEKIKMSSGEYCKRLKQMSTNGDTHLVKMTIDENYNLFPLEYSDVERLDEVVFKIKYRKLLIVKPTIREVIKLFLDSKINPQLFQVNLEELIELENNFTELNSDHNDNSSKEENKKKRIMLNSIFQNFVKKQLNLLTGFSGANFKNFNQYRYLENDFERRVLTIYHDEFFMILSTGQYFGEYALENNKVRTATIIAEEETHLGSIDISVYREHIQIEKQKLALKEMNFLLENFFFSSVEKKAFEKRYYQSFIQEDYCRGTTLFKENDEVDYIYIIKEGEVEVSINKNILEIHNAFKDLLNLKIYENENFSSILLKNEPKSFVNELLKRKLVKICLYGPREILGLGEFFFNIKHLYQVKILSDRVRMFRIDVKNFTKILQLEKHCQNVMMKMAKKKMEKFGNRLNDLKNIYLGKVDSHITEKNLFEQKKLESLNKKSYEDEYEVNNTFRVSRTILNEKGLMRIKKEKLKRLKKERNKSEEVSIEKKSDPVKIYTERTPVGRGLKLIKTDNENSNPGIKLDPFDSAVKSLPYMSNNSREEKMLLENKQIRKLKEQISFIHRSSVLCARNKDTFDITNTDNSHYQTIPTLESNQVALKDTPTHTSFNKLIQLSNTNASLFNRLKLTLPINSNFYSSDNDRSNTMYTSNQNPHDSKNSEIAYVNFFEENQGSFITMMPPDCQFKYSKKLKNMEIKKGIFKNDLITNKFIKRIFNYNNPIKSPEKEVDVRTPSNHTDYPNKYTHYDFGIKHLNVSLNSKIDMSKYLNKTSKPLFVRTIEMKKSKVGRK